MKTLELPLAIMACLGKRVALRREFEGPTQVYPAGHLGVLTSVQCDDAEGLRVTVALEDDDPHYWETMSIDHIMAASGEVTFSLDIKRGLLIAPPPPKGK